MANTKGGLLAKRKENNVAQATPVTALKTLVEASNVKQRFEEMLGKKAPGFISSMLTLVTNDKLLQRTTPQSILSACSIAASLDLPIIPSLGRAWIIPFGDKAQFIIGAKGLIELAIRSQQYRTINVVSVYEGEIQKWDKFNERATFGEKTSDVVVGYYAFFELLNGFRKAVYWTREEMVAHAQRFSKSFKSGPWQTDFDKMAEKTLVANMLRAWGPLSVEMQTALDSDRDINPDMQDAPEETEAIEAEAEVMADGNYPAGENVKMADGREVDTDTGEII